MLIEIGVTLFLFRREVSIVGVFSFYFFVERRFMFIGSSLGSLELYV